MLMRCLVYSWFSSHSRYASEMDDYNVIMVKAIADRLAEVCAATDLHNTVFTYPIMCLLTS